MNSPDYARQIGDLAKRLDRLLEATRKLSADNIQLRQQLEQVSSERSQLLSKNEMARHRVDAMLGRLDELERNDE
jgi:cell division protein ZapB